jgi:hypothetical protein
MRAEEQNQAEYETHPFSNHSIAQLLRSLEACLQEAARHLFFLVQTFICYGDKRKKEGRKEGDAVMRSIITSRFHLLSPSAYVPYQYATVHAIFKFALKQWREWKELQTWFALGYLPSLFPPLCP